MTSKPQSETIREALDAMDAADALRQKHERIGRLVVENADALRVLTHGTMDIRGVNALQAILAEVKS